MPKRLINFMLDSGAFSVWKRGGSVDLQAYIEFVQQHADLLHSYVNLDVIPGSFARMPSRREVEEAAAGSFVNWIEMRNAGLDPICVYHIGERPYWLERMLGEGATYLGLGGLVGVNSKRRKKFLDFVFHLLCGRKGWPELKVHGFGVTTPELIHRYPWTSIDSTSWLQGSKTGVCGIPQPLNPTYRDKWGYNFGKRPWQIKFSETNNGKPDLGTHTSTKHYRQITGETKKYIDKFLEIAQMDRKLLATDYAERCRIAAYFLRRCRMSHPMTPFRKHRDGFLHNDFLWGSDHAPTKHPDIFLVMPHGTKNKYIEAAKREDMNCLLLPFHAAEKVNIRHCILNGKFDNNK